jgi:hypothetical protein
MEQSGSGVLPSNTECLIRESSELEVVGARNLVRMEAIAAGTPATTSAATLPCNEKCVETVSSNGTIIFVACDERSKFRGWRLEGVTLCFASNAAEILDCLRL